MPILSQPQMVPPKLSYFSSLRIGLQGLLCGHTEQVSPLQPEREAALLSKDLCEDLPALVTMA